MRKIVLIAGVVLAGTGIFFGCKKNAGKSSNCRIVSIIDAKDSLREDFTYDSKGRISVKVSGQQVYTYDYGDNSVTITYLNAGTLFSTTTATLNQSGLAVNIRQESTQTGVAWFNYLNEYNGDELVRSTVTAADGRPAQITTYQWTDGNMTSSITGKDTAVFTYYLDKPRQQGDYLSLSALVNGYEQVRSKNLIKGIGNGTAVYGFDPDGKITALDITLDAASGGIEIDYQLQYQCE
jgi:hypothetical protein